MPVKRHAPGLLICINRMLEREGLLRTMVSSLAAMDKTVNIVSGYS